jgi:hypothetical protein
LTVSGAQAAGALADRCISRYRRAGADIGAARRTTERGGQDMTSEVVRENAAAMAASLWLGFALALVSIVAATAQGPAPTQGATSAPSAAASIDVDVLKGAWVRPDGGYLIVIRSVGPGGQLDAMYFNPNPLPFAQARALPEGATLRAYFELQAGGYAGSTYKLTYDPASDQLRGIYYQAVAKQSFDVHFLRKRP